MVASLAEIPFPVREYYKNLMLLGLWHSTITPDVDILLSSIVHDLMVLHSGGLLMDVDDKGNDKKFNLSKPFSGEKGIEV